MGSVGLISPAALVRRGDGRWGVPVLVRCPRCRVESNPHSGVEHSRTINYFCPNCQNIVRIDLARDEVKSSSIAQSLQKVKSKK